MAEFRPPVRTNQGSGREHQDVFSKPDENKRIEISKRLSWVLRRGARTSGLAIDDDGWVKVQDLPEADCLKGFSVQKLLRVVEESNQQKFRYELLDDPVRGQLIRASGKKGLMNDEQPSSPPRGIAQDNVRKPTQQQPYQGQSRVVQDGSSGSRVAAPAPVAASSQVAAPSSPASPKVIGFGRGTEATALRGPVPPGAVGSTSPAIRPPAAVAAVAAAKGKAQPSSPLALGAPAKVATGSALVAAAARPPGPAHPWGALAKAGAAVPKLPGAAANNPQMLQVLQQMQAMQQMMAVHAISAQYQAQVRQQLQELMKLRMLQQMHEMSYMQQAYAMQEMEAWFGSNAGGWWNQSGDAGFDYGDAQDGTGYKGDSTQTHAVEVMDASSMTAEELEAKMREVLQQAHERVAATESSNAGAVAASSDASPDRKVARELPVDSAGLQAKIHEALQAAAERHSPQVAAPAAVNDGGAASSKGPVDQDTMNAKVAEALAAARERHVNVTVSGSPPRPKKAAAPAAPASPEAVQAKIAEALEAARARTGKSSKAT